MTISLLSAGCGASRQAMKTAETTICDTTSTEIVETTTDRTKLERTSAEQERNEEIITVTTEYDTSLPADPATGTPPVKVRTAQVRRTAAQVRQQTGTESRESAVRTLRRETAGHAERNAAIATAESRGPGPVQRVLCAAGVLALGGAAGWLAGRRRG